MQGETRTCHNMQQVLDNERYYMNIQLQLMVYLLVYSSTQLDVSPYKIIYISFHYLTLL